MFTIFLLTTLIIFIVSTIIQSLHNRNVRTKLINKIPGPKCYPILGNVPSLLKSSENLWNYFRSLGRDYFPIYRMWNGQLATVGLMDPDDIEVLLSSKKHLRKTKVYDLLQPWLGTGLVTSAGEKWHQRRKILTPAFHFNILQKFVPVFIEQSQILVEQLESECNNPFTDVVPYITRFGRNSVCETAMGTTIDENEKQSKAYADAINKMGELLIYRITRPWLISDKLFSLTSQSKAHTKAIDILHKFSMSVINERKANFNESDILGDSDTHTIKSNKRLAMLDLLLSARHKGAAISDEGIREEVDTFMFAGHDTTTTSISFTLMLLANHLDIQYKVVQELDEVLGNSDCPITYQDLPKLRYLEQVIKESLRVYPSVPTITRITDEEIQTPTGYTIPANVYCLVQIYDLHHNPKYYPNPEKFDPERFSPENTKKRHPFAYIPFSAGPRNCIGQKFAILEQKVLIATILRKFILKPIDGPADIKMLVHIVLRSKHGIRIKFEKR